MNKSKHNKGNPIGNTEEVRVKYGGEDDRITEVTKPKEREKGKITGCSTKVLQVIDSLISGLPNKRVSMNAEDDAYNMAIDDVVKSIGKTGNGLLRG